MAGPQWRLIASTTLPCKRYPTSLPTWSSPNWTHVCPQVGAQGVNDVIGNTLRLMEQKAATLSKSKATLFAPISLTHCPHVGQPALQWWHT